MEIRLLGPVEVEQSGVPLTLGGPKQRALLSLLALNTNATVSVDRLVDGLWGEEQPPSAPKMVQVYVSQLRKLLDGDDGSQIVTHGRGYELRVDPEAVDAARFERLVAEASRAQDGVKGRAARDALALWRGPPFADLTDAPFAAAEARRLEELRLAALELAIESDLDAGRHRELIGRIESLLAEHPLREGLHRLRMLALYRAGRQAEALDAYRAARRLLVEHIGVEPGPELRRLQDAILRQDPALELAPAELPRQLKPPSPHIAGRDAEISRLRAAWRAAREGAGGVMLVHGPEGVGKTRLISELAIEVHAQDARVAYVDAAAREHDVEAALERARRAGERALIVVDDLDRASAATLKGASALAAQARDLSSLAVLAYRDDPQPAAISRLERELEARGAQTLALAPLGVDGVREVVATLYAEHRAAAAPLEELLDQSGGLPARVHAAVADWASRETEERVGVAAQRTAASRTELREVEAELAADVDELRTVRETAERYEPRERPGDGDATPVCPFKGLASFEVADSGYFFGRERLVAEIVARLVGARLLGLVGPSGSGKSSTLRAGLLPAIARGVLPGSRDWHIVLLRPGEHPLADLEQALDDHADAERVVLAVDQFEEAFTACRDAEQRAAYMDALADAAERPDGRVTVVLALRADYYGACAAYPRLARLLGESHVLVGAMQPDELARAIEGPARKAHLVAEPELVTRLVDDVAGQAGGLPLLSTALLELWQHRQGTRLPLAAYERSGGVQGAVARLAENAYGSLSDAQQVSARRLLLRLAGSGEGDAVVRRRVPLDELELDRDPQAARVLEVLAASRLVTLGEDTVEVAHEALLREWPRLRAWLEEDADGRRLHGHVTLAARDWDSRGRDASELYRGPRLTAALDWAAGHGPDLNQLEREFLEASRERSEREAERSRRTNRRLRTLLVGAGAALLVALVAGIVALEQRGDARDSALTADAQRLGAQALTEERLDNALLLARAGVDLEETNPTRSNLLSVLQRNPPALGVVRGAGWPLYAIAVSPDEKLIALGDERGGVEVFDAATRQPIGDYYRLRNGLVQTLTFSPDGKRIAVTGHSPQNFPPGALVDLIDARTQERLHRYKLPPIPGDHFFVVAHAAFLPNGRDLVVHQEGHGGPSPNAYLRRLNGSTGEVEGRPLRVGRPGFGMSATADRQQVFVTNARENATYEVDAERLRTLRRYPVGDFTGNVSPDGDLFALGSEDGRVRALDLSTGEVRRFKGRHEGQVNRLKFTPDNQTLVSAGSGDILVWDVRSGELRERLGAHDGEIDGLQISADGRTLYSAGLDALAVVWDLKGDRRLIRRFDAGPPFFVPDDEFPKDFAPSPDGRTLAVPQSDGTVSLIDTQTLREVDSLRALDGFVGSVAYSPDGRQLAVTGEGGQVSLWDPRTRRQIGELTGMEASSQAIEYSPDGSLIAAADLGALQAGGGGSAGAVHVWDARTRAHKRLPVELTSPSLAFSPDGELLAIAGIDKPTKVVDVRTGEEVAKLETPGVEVRSVAFSPDGDALATGFYHGPTQLWSTDSWKPVGPVLGGHTGRVISLDFSGDDILITASGDGTVLMHDLEARKPIGSPLTVGPDDTFISAALAHDGSELFAVPSEGLGVRFDTSPEAWKRHACVVAGRTMTQDEWEDALPDRDYRPVCER